MCISGENIGNPYKTKNFIRNFIRKLYSMSRYVVRHLSDSDDEEAYTQPDYDSEDQDEEQEKEHADVEPPVCVAPVATSFITATGNNIFRCLSVYCAASVGLCGGRGVCCFLRAHSCVWCVCAP